MCSFEGRTQSPREPCSLGSWSPGGRLEAPPGPPPPGSVPFGTPPRRRPQGAGRRPSEVKRYSRPMNSGSRSTNRRAELWADYIIKFGVRKCQITEKCHKLFEYPDAYDFARGLALSSHSSSPSSVAVELSGRRVLPFLDPLPPPGWGSLPFLISPSRWGSIFFFFLVFGGRVRRRVIGR